jgi:formamidopyrimidine-DNA glycosylase
MPELPDVEGFRRTFADHAVARPIERVDVLDPGVLRGVSAPRLRKALRGHRFAPPRRHGKWLVAPVDGNREPAILLLHFGMTGSLSWAETGEDRQRHDRVVWSFTDGELRYRDMRKLTGLRLLPDERALDRVLGETGPDALSLSRKDLSQILGRSRRQAKAALMDQSVVAGLGNLLTDEILWRARIHPKRSCAELTPGELGQLHRRMSTTLRQSVTAGQVPPRRSWLTGHRNEPDGACPRCGTRLSHARIGGRGTIWCPHCQPS